jgi:hypothetical protein
MSSACFHPFHIPPLLVASALTFGGLIPFWNPAGAILEFGLPERIAISQPAQACFVVSGARVSALGMAMWIFHLKGMLVGVDVILALLGYVGAVDAYVCWKEGVVGSAVFRGAAGVIIGGWGLLGLTAKAWR